MTSCVFPGTFDPVTKGHISLIARASEMFDHVTVTIMVNIHKNTVFTLEQRLSMLQKACRSYSNVSVDSWDGLLTDYLYQKNQRIILRGIRSAAEFEQEMFASRANRILQNQIETLFLPSEPELTGVSSSAVREIASFGGDLSGFLPEDIADEINAVLSNLYHKHN